MTDKADNYFAITGIRENKTKIKDFFSVFFSADQKRINNFSCVQLFQTYSECKIEKFNPDTEIDIGMLEQYRAFCPDWELWIRNINAGRLCFRFIVKKTVVTDIDSKINKTGYTPWKNQSEKMKNLYISTISYPLLGKLLKLENAEQPAAGWYTSEIPRIINYPAAKSWKKVALSVNNFMNRNGIVKFTMYRELIHDTGRS